MPTQNNTTPDPATDAETVVFADFVDGFRIAAKYLMSLALLLWNSRPEDLSSNAAVRLEVIKRLATQANAAVSERQLPAMVRPLFVAYVATMGGLHDALVARSRTPASISDEGDRAARLVARLFPDGAAFLRDDAYAALNAGNEVLRRIENEELAGELDAIVGPGALVGAKKAAAALGDALGVGEQPHVEPSTTNVQQIVAAYTREVAWYARIIAGETDVTDPVSVERYRRSVQKPIEKFRSRRNASGELVEPVVPADPTGPNVPPPFVDEPTHP